VNCQIITKVFVL